MLKRLNDLNLLIISAQKSYRAMAVIIRNPEHGLCLEATRYGVQGHFFTGSEAQLWILESTRDGKFIIINKQNG